MAEEPKRQRTEEVEYEYVEVEEGEEEEEGVEYEYIEEEVEEEEEVIEDQEEVEVEEEVEEEEVLEEEAPVQPDMPEIDGVEWTDEHVRIWRAYKEGRNVAVIGPAGTGKTLMVNAMLDDNAEQLHEEFGAEAVIDSLRVVCGSTGMAAVNIKGTTLHSAFGIGDEKMSVNDVLRRMRADKRGRLQHARLCVLDEFSMISATMLDLVDRLLRRIRDSDEPFGGLQMIFLGDPLQLPVVVKTTGNPRLRDVSPYMIYNAKVWRDDKAISAFTLTRIFRQADDSMVEALAGIRFGDWSFGGARMVDECCKSYEERGVEAPEIVTEAFSRNDVVEKRNEKALAQLYGVAFTYHAKLRGPVSLQKTLEKGCRAPRTLVLKEGAVVMLLKNLDTQGGLVNGRRGVVVGMSRASVKVDFGGEIGEHSLHAESWETRDGNDTATMEQIPLALAYAMTFHKLQGMTLDFLRVHLDGVWELAQVYVALSRVRTKQGLHILLKEPQKILALKPPRGVLEFLSAVQNAQMLED